MTGTEFERYVCEHFKALGYWALNIPKNKNGAQPFDVIAIKGDEVLAIDCKVLSGYKRLPFARIEENQWLSFYQMHKLTNAICGFMCWYDGEMKFVSYEEALERMKQGYASIQLED